MNSVTNRATVLIIIAILFTAISLCAKAESKQEVFRKKLTSTIVDILCTTTVIRDMDDAAHKYLISIANARNSAEINELKSKFSGNLHEIWLRQKYDLSGKQEIVQFLKFANSIPIESQSQFSKEWASAASKECPRVASDYAATVSAAITLIPVIAKNKD